MNSKPVNYKEAVEYIESIPKFTQKHMWQEPMAKVLCVHIFRQS